MKNTEVSEKKENGFNELVDAINQTLSHQLKNLFGAFFESADTVLFDLANEAGSNDEQKQYFELLQTIRVDKPNLNRGMHQAFAVYLKPVSDTSSEYDFEIDDDDDGELSLVSQDTMEEMVLINTITSKTVEKYKESIGKLELRLEYIAEQTPDIFVKDALSPMQFCLAFKEAITILDITTSDKLILYKLFDNEIASNLNAIYDALNQLLIEAGILPKVKLHQNSKSSKPSAKKYSTQAEENESVGEETGDSENTVAAESPATSGGGNISPHGSGNKGSGSSNDPGRGSENTPSNYYATEENSGSPSTSGGHAPAADTAQQGSQKQLGGYPVEQINQAISDFIGSTNANQGSVEGNRQFYGHQDVLTALTQMQAVTCKEIQQQAPVVERISASEIKQVLLSTIAGQQGGTITKQVDQVIEKTIDFIKMIFDAIIEDENISDTIKALLLTLQIPVIKASMLDKGFFVEDDHPARMLLDKIAELGVGVASNDDAVYKSINKIVRTLLEEYTNDNNAFVTALKSIEAIIAERANEAEEREKKTQQKVQKIHARKIVLWEVRKSTLDKRLPSQLHQLILKLWPTLMFNHYVKNGKENDDWVTLVTVLHELIESIQPPENNEEFKELQNTYLANTIRVERQLNKFTTVQQYKKEAMRALRATYKDLLEAYEPVENDESSKVSSDSAVDAPAASEEEIIHALDDTKDEVLLEESQKEPLKESEVHPDEPVSQRDKLQLLPLDVRPGAWFKIAVDNGRVRRLKLSIIIVEDALLVFVDHDGNRVAERDAEMFAEELKSNKSQIIMNHSVFDHALTSAFESIK